jgi:DNA repair protein RadC
MKNSTQILPVKINQGNLFLSLVAEVKISYSTQVKASDRFQITTSRDAEELLRNSWDHASIEHIETMKLILLNRANRVLGITTLSSGGTSGCILDAKTVFQYALKANASGIILSHNHPSGNRQPSGNDLDISKKIKEGGKLLDISLLDHVIITPFDGYYSMADEGDI